MKNQPEIIIFCPPKLPSRVPKTSSNDVSFGVNNTANLLFPLFGNLFLQL